MKKFLALFLAMTLFITSISVSAAGDDGQSDSQMPEMYFDLGLDLNNKSVSNAAASTETGKNTTVTQVGGEVKTMSYVHEGQLCQIPVFYAEQAADDDYDNSYLDVEFGNITGQDTTEKQKQAMEDWIFDNGITFECFVWVDGTTSASTAGLMANMSSGGIGLCSINNGGGTNFQIGSSNRAGNAYSYGSNYVASNQNSSANALEIGKFSHVVGTYDNATNTMALYIDGELIGSGSYGSGEFKVGSAVVGHLGIGSNIAYPKESLDDELNYAFADARVYKGALSEAQVKERYNSQWEEVLETAVPAVYFDLDFQDENSDGTLDKLASVGTNPATIKSVGSGTIETMDVLYQGQVCKVPVYSADKFTSGEHSYLDVTFSDITTTDEMTTWITQGISFECFIYVEDTLDRADDKTVGIMSNCNGGGITLYNVKAKEGLNFLLGTENTSNSTYVYTADKYVGAVKHDTTAGEYQNTLDGGKLTHVVATYDSESKTLALYKNGVLIDSGSYGDGAFKLGSAVIGHLGIGANVGSTSEAIDVLTGYSVVDARVYSYGLSEEEVAKEYQNRWNEVASYAEQGVTVDSLDNVSQFDSVTGTSQTLESGVPAYVYETLDSYVGCFEGESTNPGTTDSRTYLFETTNKTYLSYLKSLKEAGWQQYSNNVIGKNLFATYMKDGKSIYAYYIANKSYAYIIVSDNSILENRAVDNTYTTANKVCEPLFTEIKLVSSGNAEIIRLSDGRFIVIDGGEKEADHYQAERIYKVLEEQNVLDKITIAAWIVTHPHTDHMDACADFLSYYDSDDVILEEMIFNFPTKADGEAAQSSLADTLPSFWTSIATAKTKWPDMKIVKCHTGQEYYFADAKIEILHTIEDYFPNKVKDTDGLINDSSVAFTVEIAGQKMMFLGDMEETGSESLIKMWGDYLKADMSEISHHGMNGGTIELYELIDPTVAIIPATRGMWEETIRAAESTMWVLNNTSGNIKEIVYAGFGTRTLQLPYTPEAGGALVKNISQNGYDMEEPDKLEATIPEPYMDLVFENDTVKDGTNTHSLQMNGGFCKNKYSVL